MLISTQDGIYTAVRHAHNMLRVSTEAPDNGAMRSLNQFIGGSPQNRDFVFCTDQEFAEFLTAQIQDIQYEDYPPVPVQTFD